MKTDKEFLNGIYAKAEVLQGETNKTNTSNKGYYRFVSVAALIILIPILFFANNNLGYREIPQMIRMISSDDSSLYFYESDFIVIGEVKEIKKSKYIEMQNYIYTDIIITIDQVLKGDIEEQKIVLRVNGGKVKSEKVYSPMESEFIKGKTSLLFLRKDHGEFYSLIENKSQFIEVGDNIFKDHFGKEYSLKDIEKNIKMGED